jgi:hypothetical protein
MRAILVSSLLIVIALCGSANAATVHHAHRHAHQGMIASDPASGFAYAPPRPPVYNGFNEPYFGASQGYAPGEKERFLGSLFSP